MLNKVEIGSISFNDNTNYLISTFRGLEMPPTRVISYNLAGEHFGYLVSAFYAKRRFSLQGWVVGSSVNDFITRRDNLQSAFDAFSGERTIKFTLANGRQIQIDAVFISIDFAPEEGVTVAAKFNAEFEAAFPFLVSQTENNQNITLAYGGGGKVPPDTMPMSLAADSGGKIFVINNGNGIYYPTAKINGPVTNPALRNNTTNKDIRFTITLTSGEYLDIDFKKKTVTDNLGRNHYDTKSGDWWYIQPGTNEIRFLADAYDASALATVKYRDSYLGL